MRQDSHLVKASTPLRGFMDNINRYTNQAALDSKVDESWCKVYTALFVS
jgi:hypothetical protein